MSQAAVRPDLLVPATVPVGDATAPPEKSTDPSWCLVIGDEGDDLDDARARAAESLLCLADGMIGTRGVLEEQARSSLCVLAAGLYRPDPDVAESLMTLPCWYALPSTPDSARRAAGLGPARRDPYSGCHLRRDHVPKLALCQRCSARRRGDGRRAQRARLDATGPER